MITEHKILVGDCRETLKTLPAESAHVCVTSPPYWGLRDYQTGSTAEIGSEPTLDDHLANIVDVYREVRRVLRPDALSFLNYGDAFSGGKQGRDDCNSAMRAGRSSAGVPRRRPVPFGFKQKDLMCLPHRVAMALQADGWYLRQCVIWCKCLSGGTWLYARTQKGERPEMLKDLVRLDPGTVELWNGRAWVPVLAWQTRAVERDSDRKRNELGEHLEIEFYNGERVGCTADHRWPTWYGLKEARDLDVGDVVQSCRLPDNQRSVSGLPARSIGWLVGFYIAEGNITEKAVQFSTHRDEHAYHERIGQMADAMDASMTIRYPCNTKSAVVTVHGKAFRGIIEQYVSGGSSHDKRLTSYAWSRDNEFLQAVLDGYCNGDGHDRGSNIRLGFCQNDRWAVDVRAMCARLGHRLRLRRHMFTNQDGKFPGWRGHIMFTSKRNTSRPAGEIVAIRASRARKFYDVVLADEPHLFSLASGLLTHNSSPMPESVRGSRWERCRVKVDAGSVQSGGTLTGRQRQNFPDVNSGKNAKGLAQWQPCPGCDKCRDTDGYVYRQSAGRPTTAHEFVFLLSKSPSYYYAMDENRAGYADDRMGDLGNYTRGGNGNPYQRQTTSRPVTNPAGRNLWSYWTDISPSAFKDSHFATMPLDLARRCIKLGTSSVGVCSACGAPWAPVVELERIDNPGHKWGGRGDSKVNPAGRTGSCFDTSEATKSTVVAHRPICTCNADKSPAVVLDPFGGAGTTAIAARELGHSSVICELNNEYAAMAKRRERRHFSKPKAGTAVKPATGQVELF